MNDIISQASPRGPRIPIAIRPSSGPAWNLSLQQCESAREWTPEEIALFRGVAARIRAGHPETRVLLMSGYPEDVGLSDGEAFVFLQKPYRPDQLLETVEAVLKTTAPDRA